MVATDFVTVQMADLTSQEAYALLSSTVVPRPIAFVSTVSSAGIANLAPFSFFMVGGSNPPSLMYSPTLNSMGVPKDSLRNVLETGEFVINTVHREMAEGMNRTSFEFGPDASEWEASGFTPLDSLAVRPPRAAEALVQFECKLHQVVEHGTGPHAAQYVIGEVVLVHLANGIASSPGGLRPISRLGGPKYLDTASGDLFELVRPS